MKSSVIIFPGSNCDRDMDVALKKFGFKNQMIWHNDIDLPKNDLVVLPGGFSYGDYLRCGSIAAKSKISVLNTPGTIDSDYRGEIKVILFNHGSDEFIVNNKDRVAQMILTPILKIDFEEVDDLPKTIRGSGGFGSTGK